VNAAVEFPNKVENPWRPILPGASLLLIKGIYKPVEMPGTAGCQGELSAKGALKSPGFVSPT
jgi:hypothetical protein